MKTLLFLLCVCTMQTSFAQSFTPQNEGSKLHFEIRNFGINTGGDISGIKGKIIFDAKKLSNSSFDVTVDVNTIDTDNSRRDVHLKRDDFFNVAKYPTIHMVSTEILAGADLNHFTCKGNLTIKGVTKAIIFPFTAEAKNGGALFEAKFEINRIDYGVGSESATMSDKVKISLKTFAKAE